MYIEKSYTLVIKKTLYLKRYRVYFTVKLLAYQNSSAALLAKLPLRAWKDFIIDNPCYRLVLPWPQRALILRWASYLDAFSSYPLHT